jgi:hypothetical protein
MLDHLVEGARHHQVSDAPLGRRSANLSRSGSRPDRHVLILNGPDLPENRHTQPTRNIKATLRTTYVQPPLHHGCFKPPEPLIGAHWTPCFRGVPSGRSPPSTSALQKPSQTMKIKVLPTPHQSEDFFVFRGFGSSQAGGPAGGSRDREKNRNPRVFNNSPIRDRNSLFVGRLSLNGSRNPAGGGRNLGPPGAPRGPPGAPGRPPAARSSKTLQIQGFYLP